MAKRKAGLSVEEKINRTESFLQESRLPFTLKELESILYKTKGIVPQSVLECLETLVSENRASSEKVGVSVLFWNFFEPGENKNSNCNGSAAAASSSSNNHNKNNNNIFPTSTNNKNFFPDERSLLSFFGANNNQSSFSSNNNNKNNVNVIIEEAKNLRLELLTSKKNNLIVRSEEVDRLILAATETTAQILHREELQELITRSRVEKVKLAEDLVTKQTNMPVDMERLKKKYDLLQHSMIQDQMENVNQLMEYVTSRDHYRRREQDNAITFNCYMDRMYFMQRFKLSDKNNNVF
jgi:hypothetical protein